MVFLEVMEMIVGAKELELSNRRLAADCRSERVRSCSKEN